jgi:hypothetical protein
VNSCTANADTSGFARSAERFGVIHCNTSSVAFASNLATRNELLCTDDFVMPVTINDGELGNAWVCSPLTTYYRYALEEMQRTLHPLLSKPLALLCNACGHALARARIDDAVALNNWMLSTNLYPLLQQQSLASLVETAVQRWPGHAIWFRSLNAEQNGDWLAALRALGFMLIPSRQVYLFSDLRSKARRHENLKRDLRLLRDTPLQCIDQPAFSDEDYVRIADLYGQLYLDKYSRLNPQYTARFMQRWHQAGLLTFRVFKDADGATQAAVGMFRQGDTITAPIVGYNTALPRSLGLYRLLMAIVFDEAMATGATVNLSAGAAHFKRLRGGKPAIEYSAVLARHLPAYTRHAISLLRVLTTSIGVPVMERYEL